MGSTCAELQTNWELQRQEWNSLVSPCNCTMRIGPVDGMAWLLLSVDELYFLWQDCILENKYCYFTHAFVNKTEKLIFFLPPWICIGFLLYCLTLNLRNHVLIE